MSLALLEFRTLGIGTSADLLRQQSVDDAPAGSATIAAGTLARDRLVAGLDHRCEGRSEKETVPNRQEHITNLAQC
jgi:hypothetical protein